MAATDPNQNQQQTPPVNPNESSAMPASDYDISPPVGAMSPTLPMENQAQFSQNQSFPQPEKSVSVENPVSPNMPVVPIDTANQGQAAPPVAQAQPPVSVGSVPPTVSVSGGRKLPKKVLLIVIALLILIVGAFAVIRFVLPALRNATSGPTELVWWGLWEDDSIITPIISEYEALNPGVTIRYEKKDKESYRERLASALATEEAPDIFRIHNSWVPMFRQELAPAPVDVITSQEFQSLFYPVIASDLVGASGPVAMPLGYDSLAMFINEEIFATYGQSIPTDWNDLRQIARELTIKDEKGVITQSGASLGTTENVDHWQEIVALLMLQNGANPNKPNDAVGRGGQALQFYKQFSQTDGVWDNTQPSSTVAFSTGRVAIYFGPSWRALEIMDRAPSLKFRVEAVPQIAQSSPDAKDITYASYWAEGVFSESKHQEEAWKFLKYMSEKESLAKLFENASSTRQFGEAYPRVDMRELLLTHKVLGGVVKLAPLAKSGYLYSRTFDGDSGINSSLSQYYEDALNSINPSRDSVDTRALTTLSNGVQQVLSRYGLAAPLPTPEK